MHAFYLSTFFVSSSFSNSRLDVVVWKAPVYKCQENIQGKYSEYLSCWFLLLSNASVFCCSSALSLQ